MRGSDTLPPSALGYYAKRTRKRLTHDSTGRAGTAGGRSRSLLLSLRQKGLMLKWRYVFQWRHSPALSLKTASLPSLRYFLRGNFPTGHVPARGGIPYKEGRGGISLGPRRSCDFLPSVSRDSIDVIEVGIYNYTYV